MKQTIITIDRRRSIDQQHMTNDRRRSTNNTTNTNSLLLFLVALVLVSRRGEEEGTSERMREDALAPLLRTGSVVSLHSVDAVAGSKERH